MNKSTSSNPMPNDSTGRAEGLLAEFVGKEITSVDQGEFQLRLVFGSGISFIALSAWRLLQDSCLLIGSGDVQGSKPLDKEVDKELHCLKGLRVLSASVSPSWETRLVLESDYVFELIPDSVRYEMWEAHLEVGLAVFSGGEITFFPPAAIVR